MPAARQEPPKRDVDSKPDVEDLADPPQTREPALAITRVKLRRALAKGLVAKLTGAQAGAVKLVARYRGKTVARASGTVAADGSLAVRLRFAKAARKRFKRLARVKLAVSGGGASATIDLRR